MVSLTLLYNEGGGSLRKRQRTAAVQDAGAPDRACFQPPGPYRKAISVTQHERGWRIEDGGWKGARPGVRLGAHKESGSEWAIHEYGTAKGKGFFQG